MTSVYVTWPKVMVREVREGGRGERGWLKLTDFMFR